MSEKIAWGINTKEVRVLLPGVDGFVSLTPLEASRLYEELGEAIKEVRK